MRDLYDKLLKILNLEQSKQYSNAAVIGGLDSFLVFWLSEANSSARTPEERLRVREVTSRLDNYAAQSESQRRANILYLIERLGGTSVEPAPRPAPPAAPPPPPTKPRQEQEKSAEPRRAAPPARPEPTHSEQPKVPLDAPPAAVSPTRARQPQPAPPPAKAFVPDPSTANVGRDLALEQELARPLTEIKGIGSAKAEKYERLGIRTVADLLYHAPFRYEDYTAFKPISELAAGDIVTVAAMVQDIQAYKSPRGIIVVTAVLSDGSGTLRARWFGNQWLISQLRPGTLVRLSGKVEMVLGRLQLNSPRHEIVDDTELDAGQLVPIYPRTEGVSEKMISRDIASALAATAGRIPDPLPAPLRERYGLLSRAQALRQIHQSATMAQVEEGRRRLAFDELLRLQLGMLQQRRAWQAQPGHAIPADQPLVGRFLGTLPFTLTPAQQRALGEILDDMGKPYAMSRLLQGDVGSGKTVVAAAALLATVAAGYQGVLMAPTEILAEQHFASLRRFLNPDAPPLLDRPIVVALLSGSLSAADKEATRARLAAGEIDVLVGTHAVIQESVEFSNLGLLIVDEQHRFGVRQRGTLRSRNSDGGQPDVLVMSATPIPRSLALTLYGDLDLSLIDELPPGREPIITRVIAPTQRERAYTYIRRQAEVGRQAFIICPLVEESEKLDARAAVDEHRFLQREVFPEFQVGLLHGRMRPAEKEQEMGRFYRNETQILVSTAVVEVGIDVPNATAMLIEGANRFGLAQLHQFRGRIGRGTARSLCLLMMEEELSADAEARLNALADNQDGFALAEIDLQLRGPGDFFGTRQSGLPELQMARLSDMPTLAQAREAAATLLAHDPDLSRPAHALLRLQVDSYWQRRGGDLS